MATSLPLPGGLPLDAARWEQTPLVVRQVVVQLRAVIQHQAARIAALDARVQQRARNSDRPSSSDLPYEKPTARSGGQSTLGIARYWWRPWRSSNKAQACSCGQTEVPATRPSYTHQVIEWPEIQMTVRPLFLGTLLPLHPDGVLVMDARVHWQVPHPWSLWQALMTPEDRASCRREDLLTVVAELQGPIAE